MTPETHRPKRILLIDDDEDCRTIYPALLEHAGFAVHSAANGPAGLAVARAIQPDLVLLDIAMPVLGGREVRAAIKRDPRMAATPVVALTAHHTDEWALRDEFDAVVIKPVDPGVLLDLIDRIIDG